MQSNGPHLRLSRFLGDISAFRRRPPNAATVLSKRGCADAENGHVRREPPGPPRTRANAWPLPVQSLLHHSTFPQLHCRARRSSTSRRRPIRCHLQPTAGSNPSLPPTHFWFNAPAPVPPRPPPHSQLRPAAPAPATPVALACPRGPLLRSRLAANRRRLRTHCTSQTPLRRGPVDY